MTNLKIKEIETLERLSLDEMEQVVGGRGRNRGLVSGRVWWKFNRLPCRRAGGANINAQTVIDNGGIDLDLGSGGGLIIIGGFLLLIFKIYRKIFQNPFSRFFWFV